MPENKIVYVPLTEEDINNIKVARQRILDVLPLINDYNALEIFTFNYIITYYEGHCKD